MKQYLVTIENTSFKMSDYNEQNIVDALNAIEFGVVPDSIVEVGGGYDCYRRN